MKKVSAIIVNWNGKKETADCIQSLLDQEYPDVEIIVSDNGSTDGSVEFLKERFSTSILLLENGRNLGFGTAVNRGLDIRYGSHSTLPFAWLHLSKGLLIQAASAL